MKNTMNVGTKSYTGLVVRNQEYAIRKAIYDAPTKILTREFIQNTMECEKVTKVCIGEIEVKGFSAKKFYIINNGKGMSAKEISNLREIYGSHKNPDGDLQGNNNTGARVISLKTNMLGTIFISKHNGEINGCIFTRDEKYNTDFRLISTKNKSIKGFINDKYNLMKDYSYLLGENCEDQDWTIVITLGNEKNQNTFIKPDAYANMDYENYVNELMLNRYYKKVNTFKDDTQMIEFFIDGKQIAFTKDAIDSVKGQSWEFSSNVAKYEVKYSENWGKVIPKSFIVYQNEMFEVVSQAYQNNPFIENSSSFMRDLGAINLRDNLSIVITPLKTKDFIMTHLRDQLKYNNEYKNEQVKLSHFIEDFRTCADASLKKLIEDSNKNKSFDNISKELMDELMNNLIDNDRDLSGKFKNHQKTKRTIKEKDDSIQVEENQIDNSFLDLLDKYPLIRYNLTLSSLEKNIPEEELKEMVKEFIKYSNKVCNKIKRNEMSNILDTLKVLLSKSNYLLTKSISNVLSDLTTIKSNIIDQEDTLNIYMDLIKYFLNELKHDIGESKSEDKNGLDNEHNTNILKPLEVDLLNKEDWNIIYKDIEKLEENKDRQASDFFAIYSDRRVSINIEHKFFTRIQEDFIEDYLKRNFVEDIDFIKDNFRKKVSVTFGYLCAYYNMFDFLVPEELVLKNEENNISSYLDFISAEHLLSSKLEITRVLERELKNTLL